MPVRPDQPDRPQIGSPGKGVVSAEENGEEAPADAPPFGGGSGMRAKRVRLRA
ncbi:MAG: hypothetical protein HSCHL_2675 [Hydrogenibacillus schlegelii]|uniref:Uncharacterized protein n=1 Tax=Hydrogenibacillus schlegelii TaxID=1484 RepID=A0A2T5G9C8_HYDSH|nr:MAG: hypothetical protein HSCHL_2675 [Hydrogenibacillus schlegelii]